MFLVPSWFSPVVVLALASCSVMAFQAKVPSLDGQWQAVAGMRSGRELDPGLLAAITVSVANGELMIAEPGIVEKAAIFRLVPGNPGQMDLKVSSRGKTLTLEGIYQLEGDQLTMCISKSGERGSRPKAFEATGEGISLLKLKRASQPRTAP